MTVDEREAGLPVPALYDDRFIPGHKRLVDAVHDSNVKILAQLAYATSWGDKKASEGIEILGPSATTHNITGLKTREMTVDEIRAVEKSFADAATRAKNAGYDGVEIHGAHHFLLSQFLTPYFNRRTDEYGGSIENRARMLIETYEVVRKAVGNDYPIWIKINCEDFLDEGAISFEEFLYVCRELARRGVDAIEPSANWFNLASKPDIDMAVVYRGFWDLVIETASKIDASILLTGGNREYRQMAEILNTSKITAFGMATPMLREPAIVKRFEQELQGE
jgi:2,4-dienoyl-CoA reductase-like NADH-dependent reductase (Old Yellow Enzyme family)